MKKYYPLVIILLVTFCAQSQAFSKFDYIPQSLNSKVESVAPNGITGNLSICLPGPNTTQLTGSGTPAAVNPWVSSNPDVATVSNTGFVTAVNYGATTITYTDDTGFVFAENVYVSTFPTITSPSGSYSTCAGGTLQLNGSIFPNAITPWSSSNTAIATVDNTGLVYGVSGGTCTITYSNLGGCTVNTTVTINPLLTPVITCGVWTANQVTYSWTAVPGASMYTIVYSINGGTFVFGASGTNLTYTLTGVLQTDDVFIFVTPSGSMGNCFAGASQNCQSTSGSCPEAGVSGSTTVCDTSGTTIDLFAIISGEDSDGTWVRTSGTGGTFDASAGTFTPAMGATTSSFMYTVIGTIPCPDDSSIATITINTAPSSGILSGVQNICVGLTTSFTSTATGGVWSSSNPAVATVNPVTGLITGMAAGVATMTYTMSGAVPCVSDTATRIVTVNAPPEQPSIQGFQGICVGTWTVFTANPPGGTWSSSNNAVAMVDFTGFILGSSAGVTTISYTVAGFGGCADRTAFRDVTVSTTPTIVLASAPNTANQTVCENTPITPIIYNIGTFDAQDAMAISLPAGVSGSYNAGVLTITGTPAASGTFPYSAIALGPCGSASLSGTITVNPSISTTMFCDPSGVITPNSVRIDWANIVGVTSYEFEYTINNGPLISGSTNISNYEVLDVLPGQSVTFTLTNALGVSCFQPASVTCNSLANESFELDAFQSFPNPVSNVLNLTSSNSISNVAISNALGQSVLNKAYNSKSIQIDMSGLMSGIYMIKISSSNTSKTIKIIKN